MSKDSIMALFNKPPSAPETVHHPVPIIGMGVTGQASFTGYPPNIQAHGSSYGMNATSGVGMAGGMPTIPNIAVPVGSGIGQPQAPMPSKDLVKIWILVHVFILLWGIIDPQTNFIHAT